MPQSPTRSRVGVRPLVDHDLTVDYDELDSLAVLERLLVSGAIDDALLVEDGDVCERTSPQLPAIAQPRVERARTG